MKRVYKHLKNVNFQVNNILEIYKQSADNEIISGKLWYKRAKSVKKCIKRSINKNRNKMEKLSSKLKLFNACNEAVRWAEQFGDDYKLAWEKCERGDHMLWIAKKLNVDDRKLTMAKYHCAAQVLHLMKDQRSLDAMTASLRYANGEITRQELNDAAAYAAYAAYAADADAAAYAAAYAAADAADAADADAAYADAAYAAAAADAADAAYAADADADAYAAAAAYDAAADAARKESLKKSADICRQYLTEEVFIQFNKL